MFDSLHRMDRGEATSVIYYSIRLLKHLERVKGDDFLRKARILIDEATNEEFDLVINVIREIEAVENLKLEDLSQEKAEFYIITLSELILERNRKELNLDPERGRRLLRELREAVFTAPLNQASKTSL